MAVREDYLARFREAAAAADRDPERDPEYLREAIRQLEERLGSIRAAMSGYQEVTGRTWDEGYMKAERWFGPGRDPDTPFPGSPEDAERKRQYLGRRDEILAEAEMKIQEYRARLREVEGGDEESFVDGVDTRGVRGSEAYYGPPRTSSGPTPSRIGRRPAQPEVPASTALPDYQPPTARAGLPRLPNMADDTLGTVSVEPQEWPRPRRSGDYLEELRAAVRADEEAGAQELTQSFREAVSAEEEAAEARTRAGQKIKSWASGPMELGVAGKPTVQLEERELGLTEEAARSVGRFPGMALESIGGTIEALPRRLRAGGMGPSGWVDVDPYVQREPLPAGPVLGAVEQFGRYVGDFGQEWQERGPMSPSLTQPGAFFRDPLRYIAAHGPQTALTFGGQMLGARMLGGALAGGATGIRSERLRRFVGFAAPTTVLETGLSYREALKRHMEAGMTMEEAGAKASEEALLVGIGNTALEFLPFTFFVERSFPGAGDTFKKLLQNKFVSAGVGAATEGTEEVLQEAWGNVVAQYRGQDPKAWDNMMERALASFTLAALVGGPVGYAQAPGVQPEAYAEVKKDEGYVEKLRAAVAASGAEDVEAGPELGPMEAGVEAELPPTKPREHRPLPSVEVLTTEELEAGYREQFGEDAEVPEGLKKTPPLRKFVEEKGVESLPLIEDAKVTQESYLSGAELVARALDIGKDDKGRPLSPKNQQAFIARIKDALANIDAGRRQIEDAYGERGVQELTREQDVQRRTDAIRQLVKEAEARLAGAEAEEAAEAASQVTLDIPPAPEVVEGQEKAVGELEDRNAEIRYGQARDYVEERYVRAGELAAQIEAGINVTTGETLDDKRRADLVMKMNEELVNAGLAITDLQDALGMDAVNRLKDELDLVDRNTRLERINVGELEQAELLEAVEEVTAPPAEPAPWVNATAEDEGRWFGTLVEYTAQGETIRGTVRRVLNNGTLIEITPQGQEGSFRIPAENVRVIRVVDYEKGKTPDEEGFSGPSGLNNFIYPTRIDPDAISGRQKTQWIQMKTPVGIFSIRKDKSGQWNIWLPGHNPETRTPDATRRFSELMDWIQGVVEFQQQAAPPAPPAEPEAAEPEAEPPAPSIPDMTDADFSGPPDEQHRPVVIVGHSRSGKVIDKLKKVGFGRMEITSEETPRLPQSMWDPYSRTGLDNDGLGQMTQSFDDYATRHPMRPYKGEPWAIDSGVYAERKKLGEMPIEQIFYEPWLRRIEMVAKLPEDEKPYLVILPDVPYEAEPSLEMSRRWLARAPKGLPYYLPVQDNMTPEMVEEFLNTAKNADQIVGIALGGSNDFKAKQATRWLHYAHGLGLKLHYLRAGTLSKLQHAIEIGADSIDSAFMLWTEDRLDEYIRAWQGTPTQTVMLLPTPIPDDPPEPTEAGTDPDAPVGTETDPPDPEPTPDTPPEGVEVVTTPETRLKSWDAASWLEGFKEIQRRKEKRARGEYDTQMGNHQKVLFEHPQWIYDLEYRDIDVLREISKLPMRSNYRVELINLIKNKLDMLTGKAGPALTVIDLDSWAKRWVALKEAPTGASDKELASKRTALLAELIRNPQWVDEAPWEVIERIKDGTKLQVSDFPEFLQPAVQARIEEVRNPNHWKNREMPVLVQGSSAVVRLPGDGSKVKVRWVLVRPDDVYPSNDSQSFAKRPEEEYPGIVQNRTYDGPRGEGARNEVIAQTQAYDADEGLDPTNSADGGPPMVTRSGVAIAGNQRAMMVQRLVWLGDKGRYSKYQDRVVEVAQEQWGFDPEAVAAAIKDGPIMVVRVIVDESIDQRDEDRLSYLNRMSDESRSKSKDPVSDAMSRARHFLRATEALSHFEQTIGEDETLAEYLDSVRGQNFMAKLVETGVIPQSQRSKFMAEDGTPTKEGKAAIAKMFEVAAFNADVVDMAPASILNKLSSSLAAITRANAVDGWNMAGLFQQAFEIHLALRAYKATGAGSGYTIEKFLTQGDAFTPDASRWHEAAVKLAIFLDQPKAKMRPAFERYAKMAKESVGQAEVVDMFGTAAVTPNEARKIIWDMPPWDPPAAPPRTGGAGGPGGTGGTGGAGGAGGPGGTGTGGAGVSPPTTPQEVTDESDTGAGEGVPGRSDRPREQGPRGGSELEPSDRPGPSGRAGSGLPSGPSVRPEDAAPSVVAGQGGTGGAEGATAPTQAEVVPVLDRRRVTPRPDDSRARKSEIEAANDSDVFVPSPSGLEGRRVPHPRLIVEPRSQAGMEAPPPANIHSELVRDAWGSSDVKRTLSDEQYAMIGRVVNAWNNGHGFLVADDVGVGKTREFAGAILEAIERGSKRLVYVTKNQQTLSDALAEFKAVAGGKFPARIVNLREHKKKDGKLPSPEGDEPILYVFTSGSSNKIPRWIDQLVEVGADALFADEAHIFKNVNGSGIGRAWVILHQAMLKNPEALFMYGTATPGVTLEDFTYLYGLKEWAIGSFDQWVAWKMGRGEKPEVGDYSGDVDFAKLGGKTKIDALETTISAAVTEQIIRELKGAGKFMARDLWRGGVEFNVEMVDLLGESEEAQARREEYDRVAAFARRVQVAVQKFKGTDASMKYMGGDRSQLQSFLKQLLFQMRLPTVIEMAKREIAAGRQVVISVHNITGDDPEPGVEVIPSKRLEAAIDQVQYRIRMYDKATEQWITVKEDPVAKGEWLALREEAKKMPVLQDPLELIQQELGEDNVAFVVGKVNGKVFPASKRIANVREFQAGRKPVIVISKAGKEGISLHDTNGRQRVMLVADYEWRADTFKQELGRVDRAGQKSKPRLVLVASNLAGERKFAATIQARMASLGATSKGSAESVGVDAMEVFDSSGRTAASAMRTVVEELDELDHQYFTASAFRDLVNGKRKRMARAPAMKTFLTDLVFMPIHVSSRVMDRWIQQNQADMAGRSAIEKMLNRTGAMRGQILRVTELNQDGEPELKLYEILNENNRRYAILSGYVTEYNDRIQKTGKKTAHHYVHFTETASGAMLAGMAINLAHARRVMEEFGADVPPSDVDSAWQTLMAMDPVEVRGDLVTPQSDEIWTLKAARSRQYIAIMTGDGSEESAIAVRTKLLEEGIIEPKDGFTGRHRSQQVYWMPATKAVLEDFLERYPLAHTGQQASDFEIDGGRSSEYESPMGGFSGTPDPASQRGLHRKKRTMEATIQRNRPFPNMEVIKALADLTEIAGQRIPIRWGHISQWTAAGIYKVHPRVARIRAQWDVDTAIHEVAHALEDLLWGHPKGGPWQKKITGVAKVHQKELVDLGKALYGSRKPRGGGYKTEGFAEFIRILVSDPDVAESYAPAFYKWFQDFVLADQPALQAKLQEVTEKYRIWDQQGAVLRQRARMGRFYTPKAQVLRDFQRIRSSVTMEQLVDMAWPLRQLSKEYTMLTGKQLPPEKDPWQLMNAWRMAHASRVAYMVEQGMIDLAGQVVGRPLADVNGLVKRKDRDLFSLYLWAKRAVKLWTDPQRPRDPGMPLDDAVYIRDQLDKEFPKWRQAASIVYRWNDQLLSYVAEASPAVFGQVVKDIRRRDPGAYVPLQRWWEEMDRALMSTGVSRSGDRRSFIKKLRGSGLPVKDPFITMIAQAEKLVQAAHERAIIDAIFDLREVPGMGRLIEEVPRERIPVAARTLEQMIEEVENRLEKMGASLTIEVEEGEELDLAGEIITFFGQKQWPGTTEPIFPVYHRGKLRFYSVQPDIYRTLGALDVFRLRHDIPLVSGMLKVLEGNASIYRAGTTGLRATFGLVTNPIRDLPTLWVNTRSHKIAPVVFYYWMKSFVRVGLNQATGIDYAWFDLFKRLGGEMAQPLAADIRHTNRVARRILENRFQRIIDVRGYMDFYRDIVQAPEATPRVAELEMLATKMGWEPGMPMDLRMSIELLNAAKQVTTDFSAAGEAMRAFNRVIPFLNAQIQGPRANIRAALRESDYKGLAGKRRYQIQFAWKMLQLTALGFWLWYDNKDEEWYRELPLREKMLYWNIPFTRNDGTDELLRLPGAFEAHVVSQLPILMLDAWYRDDPEAAKEYLGILVQQFSPLELHPIPGFGGVGRIPGGMPLIDEAIQQALNRDTFWDTPIVPKRLEDYEDPDQYDDYTTRAAIYLGEKFGWSPKRIDHAMRGVVGPLASDLAALGGYGPEGTPKELFGHLSDIPLAGVLFRRGGQMGTRARSIDRFYDVLEERYTKRDRDWPGDEEPDPDFPPEPKNHRQARLAMEDAARAISMITRVANAEGRDQSQDLMREAIAIARLALETIDDGIATEAERELLRDLRRESEVRAGEAEPPTVRPPGAVGRLPRLRPDRLR